MDIRSISSISSCLALTDIRWSSWTTQLKQVCFVWLFQKYSGVGARGSHIMLYLLSGESEDPPKVVFCSRKAEHFLMMRVLKSSMVGDLGNLWNDLKILMSI